MPVDAPLQPLFERIEADRACRYRADATPEALARLEATLKFPLPPSYLAFLRRFNVEVAAGGKVTEIPFDHGALVADEVPAPPSLAPSGPRR